MQEITTLQQMLRSSVKQHADRNCLSFVGRQSMTYAAFGEQVAEVQRMLVQRNVHVGDKVAILSQNMPSWGVAYMAIVSMGAVVVPMLPDFSRTEVENVLNHSDAKLVFISERTAPKIAGLNIPNVQEKIMLESLTSAFAEPADAVLPTYDVKPNDLAAIIYTSGTTGKNKGVMLSHRNLVAQLQMVYKLQPVEKEDTFLSILPLPHTYENSLGLLLPIYRGAAVYYLDKAPTPSVLLPAVEAIRPTYMLTVPLIIEKIFRQQVLPQLRATRLLRAMYAITPLRKLMHRKAATQLYQRFGGRLKFFGIGGAKLDATVERFLIEGKSFPYAIGYGLTETAPLIAGANPQMVRLQSTGPVLQGVRVHINEPNAQTGAGEIWVKGPNVMQGYYKDATMTAKSFSTDGWFKTGDLGVIDRRGNLFIKGRLKNMILSASGENIYPEEIESVINNFQYVQDSLVVEQKGSLVAMVHFNQEEIERKLAAMRTDMERYIEQLTRELKEYINSQVSRFAQVSAVIALPSDFEKTSTMKIKRYLYQKS